MAKIILTTRYNPYRKISMNPDALLSVLGPHGIVVIKPAKEIEVLDEVGIYVFNKFFFTPVIKVENT
jgi:hypothetical protein